MHDKVLFRAFGFLRRVGTQRNADLAFVGDDPRPVSRIVMNCEWLARLDQIDECGGPR